MCVSAESNNLYPLTRLKNNLEGENIKYFVKEFRIYTFQTSNTGRVLTHVFGLLFCGTQIL